MERTSTQGNYVSLEPRKDTGFASPSAELSLVADNCYNTSDETLRDV